MALPRPETRQVEEVLQNLAAECASGKTLPTRLAGLDQRLLTAAVADVRQMLQKVLCRFGKRVTDRPAHDYRSRNMLTACGWIKVLRGYCPSTDTHPHGKRSAAAPPFPLDATLGLEYGATPAARDAVARCATLCGSFAEGRDMLVRLTPLRIGISTLRAMALYTGQKALDRQEKPAPDIRPPKPVPTASEHRPVFPITRTMFIMMDGTGVPCTKMDTAQIAGRGPDGVAGKRELKVGIIGYYSWLDYLERPIPEPGSTTHIISAAEAGDFGTLLRRAADSRGYGSALRVQIVGDGADWIANIALQNFRDATFTADFYHACEHLHALCLELHLTDEATRQAYRRLKSLLFRRGASALLRRFTVQYASTLRRSSIAKKELAYFQKRTQAMRYALFRKQGLYIASGHAEAACRTDVVRRCKQAGMHWRHHNAARICAILASLRSHSFAA
jgi:hypothetical protein